jgi:uncharacterized protein (TIGR02600 family)
MPPLSPNHPPVSKVRFVTAPWRYRYSGSGIALIIVLGMLALISILIVAFLTSASVELRSSKSYSVGLDAHSLADSAVNIVIAQVQDATFTSNQNYAWASQPGMIRTYDSTGNLVTAYKLYSSNTMRTSAYNPATEIPTTWASTPDQYVDLNAPVVVAGYTNYPIVNPSAVATAYVAPGGTGTAVDGSTNAPIEGCYLTNASSFVTTSNPIPMPVQWMYVLQDGTFATMSATGSLTSVATGAAVTSSNPVTGRVAFWTDDECSKVNVNTSGEGTYWDRPMTSDNTRNENKNTGTFYTNYDLGFLASSMPMQNEFQRYPGHPAMTSLSGIFPTNSGESKVAYDERIYSMIPRLATGGSESGSIPTTTTTATPVPNANHLYATPDEFLFSSAATTPRTVNLQNSSPSTSFSESAIERTRFFLTTSSRAPEVNMFNKPRICLWPLQANTVTNSVVTPAPACWSPTDRLIAFCSTIGGTNGTPYYFQRYNSYDASTVRTSSQTYSASLTQTPIPSSQSINLDWTLNGTSPNWTSNGSFPNRNQALYTYLQYLTSNPIPGLGGSLSGSGGKYSTSVRDQILTEMLDFIRSDVVTAETSTATPSSSYFYAPGQQSGYLVTGERQVVPLEFQPPVYPGNGNSYSSTPATYTTKGFGRFETIQQAVFVFYRLDYGTQTSATSINQNTTPISTTGTYSASTTNPVNIGVVLLLDPFNPTPGSRSWCPNMRVVLSFTGQTVTGGHGAPTADPVIGIGSAVAGLGGSSSVYGIPAGFPASTTGSASAHTSTGTLLVNGIYDLVNSTALMGPEKWFQYNNVSGGNGYKVLGQPVSGSEEKYYPFYGAFQLTTPPTIGSTAAPGTFLFTPPASITATLYSGYDATLSNPIQTITMPFPSGSIYLPVPTVSSPSTAFTTNPNLFTDYNARIGDGPNPWAVSLPNGATNNTPNTNYPNPNPYPQTGLDASDSVDYDNGHNPSPLIMSGDSARNVEVRYGGFSSTAYSTPTYNLPVGDMRLLSGLAAVPSSYFDSYGDNGLNPNSPQGDDYGGGAYSSSSTPIIESLRSTLLQGYTETENYHGETDSGAFTGPLGMLINTGVTPSGSYPTGHPYGLYGEMELDNGNKYMMYPSVPRGLTPFHVRFLGLDGALHPGDWDTGPGNQPDGPYINKPDESDSGYNGEYSYGSAQLQYGGDQIAEEQGNTFAPNRLIASAVAFGSLPTGIDPSNPATSGTSPAIGSQSGGGMRPWQTLLFCPNPASEAGNSGAPVHPGFGSYNGTATNAPPYTIPPDHAFLDFFNMPVVAPYAISEPFSTAGKINMNYQIVPFTYLNRDTGVRAVLRSVRMLAIPQTDAGNSPNGNQPAQSLISTCYKVAETDPSDYRYTINADEASGTLAGFQQRFNAGDIFRSASEICSIYLVPQYGVHYSAGAGEAIGPDTAAGNPAYSSMNSWWSKYTLTGDNAREAPYNSIYPRLTTKSNTYTVHVWTQKLQKAPATAANVFVDGTDQVTSEFRGSYTIQRYLDPNSSTLITTDGTSPSNLETYANAVVGPYKFRVVSTKRFAP